MPEGDAALYEEPFRWMEERVYPMRQQNRLEAHRPKWWRHLRPRPEVGGARRPVALRRDADRRQAPDLRLVRRAYLSGPPADRRPAGRRPDGRHPAQPVPRALVAPALHVARGNDPRYTPSMTFETFPFPAGVTPNVPAASYATDPRAIAVAEAARRLVELRSRWLNPPEWVTGWTSRLPDEPLHRPPAVARRRAAGRPTSLTTPSASCWSSTASGRSSTRPLTAPARVGPVAAGEPAGRIRSAVELAAPAVRQQERRPRATAAIATRAPAERMALRAESPNSPRVVLRHVLPEHDGRGPPFVLCRPRPCAEEADP